MSLSHLSCGIKLSCARNIMDFVGNTNPVNTGQTSQTAVSRVPRRCRTLPVSACYLFKMFTFVYMGFFSFADESAVPRVRGTCRRFSFRSVYLRRMQGNRQQPYTRDARAQLCGAFVVARERQRYTWRPTQYQPVPALRFGHKPCPYGYVRSRVV